MDLLLSICFAAMHVLLEVLIIWLDARASEMSLRHYAVVCLGARLHWVPFEHQIRGGICKFYDFENIEFQFKCLKRLKYRIEYEFRYFLIFDFSGKCFKFSNSL